MTMILRSINDPGVGALIAAVDMVDGRLMRVAHTAAFDPGDRDSAERAWSECMAVAHGHPSAPLLEAPPFDDLFADALSDQPCHTDVQPSWAGDGAVEPAALRVGPRRPAPVPARIDWPVLGTWAVIGVASSAWVACIAITVHAVWKAVMG